MTMTPFTESRNLVVCSLAICGWLPVVFRLPSQITQMQITQLPIHYDPSSRRPTNFLHALHQLFSSRAECDRFSVGVVGWNAEPSRSEFVHDAVWSGPSSYASRTHRTFI